ncbi:unnamed protein product [Prorocentrum cordatum]|uniref:EamA domain-containing protein n=1 Tax=Prorocentrum cordatum TaxID=2364126 RepID=A0ABN9UZR3_9DINO|nr:unnamed protein product [Polarella glacialis]
MGAPAAPRPRGLAPAACCLAACLLPRAGALPEAVVQGSPLRALAQPHAELDLTRPPGVVYPQRYPPRDDPRERPLAEAQKSRVNQATGVHKVQHVALLNKPGLWAIMAAIIICIGSSVIRTMEFIEASADPEQCSVPGSLSKDSLAGADEGRGKGRQILGLTPQSFLRLIVSIVGLNFAMLFWGIAQEYMMTTVYEDSLGNEEKMPSALCLVLFNRLCTMALAGSLLWVERGRAAVLEPVSWIAAMPSATNLLASWCQYQSLAYVSFPLQTAAKSAKLLPVIVISTLRGKRHTILDYAEGLVIVSALVVFGFELDGGSESVEVSGKGLGVLFLCGLLCFDSITPHFQDHRLHVSEAPGDELDSGNFLHGDVCHWDMLRDTRRQRPARGVAQLLLQASRRYPASGRSFPVLQHDSIHDYLHYKTLRPRRLYSDYHDEAAHLRVRVRCSFHAPYHHSGVALRVGGVPDGNRQSVAETHYRGHQGSARDAARCGARSRLRSWPSNEAAVPGRSARQ